MTKNIILRKRVSDKLTDNKDKFYETAYEYLKGKIQKGFAQKTLEQVESLIDNADKYRQNKKLSKEKTIQLLKTDIIEETEILKPFEKIIKLKQITQPRKDIVKFIKDDIPQMKYGDAKTRLEVFKLIANIFNNNELGNNELIMVLREPDGVKKADTHNLSNIKAFRAFGRHHTALTKKGYKNRADFLMYQYYGEEDGDADHDVDVSFYFYNPSIAPKQFLHFLKDGDYNCVLKLMKEHAEELNNETNLKKIEKLNSQFFENGVRFEDIEYIAKQLKCNVEIYNKIGDMVYSYDKFDSKKTFKYTISKLNHADQYEKIFDDVNKKPIVYLNDEEFNQEFKKLRKEEKQMVVKKSEDEIHYYYTHNAFYKRLSTKEFDDGCHHILTIEDKLKSDFEKENNIRPMVYNEDPIVYDFINRSCHHAYQKFYTDNIQPEMVDDDMLDVSEFYCYDRNKSYASYKYNSVYETSKFPASNKFEIYEGTPTNDELRYLLENKAGFAKCIFTNIPNKAIQTLGYFVNGYIYPFNSLLWALNNGIEMKITYICFTNWKDDINMSQEFVDKKIYNKLFGCYVINKDYKEICMLYNDIEELRDILFYSKDRITSQGNDWFKFKQPIQKQNKAHIASYIYGYNAINVMEKLIDIDYQDIVLVKVDCIVLKNEYSNFTISNKLGDWKIENSNQKMFCPDTVYINKKEKLTPEGVYKLTSDKIYSKKINFVYAGAGCGKTSRFYKVFGDQDERLHKNIFAFPNHELKFLFDEQSIPRGTYQALFNTNTKNPLEYNKELISYTNCCIDEATMINIQDFQKIINWADKCKVKIYIIGDYDIQKKEAYQLKPVEGKCFVNADLSGLDYYSIECKTNYRQGQGDFVNLLNKFRMMTNDEIIDEIDNHFETVDYKKMIEDYKINDVILSSVNKYCNSINKAIYKKEEEDIKIKYLKTSKTHGKNQMEILNRNKFDSEKMSLAYAGTFHLCQGKTYTENIYIIVEKMFCERLMYVALSRAKQQSQIKLVYLI